MSETTAPTGGSKNEKKVLKVTEDLKDKFGFEVVQMDFEVDMEKEQAKQADGDEANGDGGSSESGTIIKPGAQASVPAMTYLGILVKPDQVIEKNLEEAERDDREDGNKEKEGNSRDE